MRSAVVITGTLMMLAFAGCIGDSEGTDNMDGSAIDSNGDGHVVVAVIDSGFNPYHWDFLADHMPQQLNDDPDDDVPLHLDPTLWLHGFPNPDEAFASYDPLNLTLNATDPKAFPGCFPGNSTSLITGETTDACPPENRGLAYDDYPEWQEVQSSSLDAIHYEWIPGTKIVGYVNFGGGTGFAASSHGVGSSSVSVGNIHGSCPHCLMVFVNGLGEEANRWVESQDWIDAQTNSWGYSAGVAVRDRFYSGSDVESQRAAVERGQAIFFSGGNGLGNTFTAPNPTLFSSQEGPDWIITVGAINPTDGTSYTGHGKPADVAAIGSSYPSAGGSTVTANSTFGGTSNATPVTAGMYAEALWRIRNMDGTRIQQDMVISQGGSCGDVNPDCALADGELTYVELREAVFAAAEHTRAGYVAGIAGVVLPATQNNEELTYLAEGHGSFYAKLDHEEIWEFEVSRIVDIVTGEREVPDMDSDLAAWRNAVSYCTQILWGEWDHGHRDDANLPEAHEDWPVRTWLVDACPTQGPAIMAANHAVTDAHPLY